MDFDVSKVKVHDRHVYRHHEMDELRAEHCLCLNCREMAQGCLIAGQFYDLCQQHDIALAITRCPHWRSIQW